mmetsp:Transcript_34662/g.107192  ORF Transcript_34662/g.107192 Transcript_34662/m.107192 type:complete len:237 (-) Transcript_34662:56-766(-)
MRPVVGGRYGFEFGAERPWPAGLSSASPGGKISTVIATAPRRRMVFRLTSLWISGTHCAVSSISPRPTNSLSCFTKNAASWPELASAISRPLSSSGGVSPATFSRRGASSGASPASPASPRCRGPRRARPGWLCPTPCGRCYGVRPTAPGTAARRPRARRPCGPTRSPRGPAPAPSSRAGVSPTPVPRRSPSDSPQGSAGTRDTSSRGSRRILRCTCRRRRGPRRAPCAAGRSCPR